MAFALSNFIFSQSSSFPSFNFKQVAEAVSSSKQAKQPKKMTSAFKDNVHLTLKAQVPDDVEKWEETLFNYTQTIGQIANQEDIYFNVPFGQLKLRTTRSAKDCGELIASKPVPNFPGLVEIQGTSIQDVDTMRMTLGLAMNELGSIKKRRRVYVKDNVRINLDTVEELGTFVDIEIYKLNDVEDYKTLAQNIKNELGLNDAQLIGSTYLDLFRALKTTESGFEDDETSDSSI
ncbi:CYTH domain-containing protein [Aphelenchoides besseyi]|nr:CYTH domain-containing protein [Aphelenchoides besseyi]KAI6194427.1 CYTH domain-containing protein [Aphelenchoides besseyi]